MLFRSLNTALTKEEIVKFKIIEIKNFRDLLDNEDGVCIVKIKDNYDFVYKVYVFSSGDIKTMKLEVTS